jgi:hypothetical protein
VKRHRIEQGQMFTRERVAATRAGTASAERLLNQKCVDQLLMLISLIGILVRKGCAHEI